MRQDLRTVEPAAIITRTVAHFDDIIPTEEPTYPRAVVERLVTLVEEARRDRDWWRSQALNGVFNERARQV